MQYFQVVFSTVQHHPVKLCSHSLIWLIWHSYIYNCLVIFSIIWNYLLLSNSSDTIKFFFSLFLFRMIIYYIVLSSIIHCSCFPRSIFPGPKKMPCLILLIYQAFSNILSQFSEQISMLQSTPILFSFLKP